MGIFEAPIALDPAAGGGCCIADTDLNPAGIILFASSKIGAPYSIRGAVMSTDMVMCRIVGSKPATFFCSKLVMEAYKQAGRPLSSSPSQCVTPNDLVTIARNKLAYVGHLLGNPSWFPVIVPN
jgi:hypothetical protein